jgi:hypothetical protein
MREFGRLLCNGSGDFWAGMANVHSTYTTSKVNILVAIYVFDYSPIGLSCKYVHGRSNTPCNEFLAASDEVPRFGAWDV